MRLVILILLFLSQNTFAQRKAVFNYTTNDSINYPATEIDTLISFSKYNAVVYGETHTLFFEPEFKFQLIKQLNSQYGFRDVFMEIGNSCAYLFNRFLNTGDTSVLRKAEVMYVSTKGHYRDFWIKLYQYNQTLPSTQRIRIHGVDFERKDAFSSLLLLKSADKNIPLSLQPTFQIIEQAAVDTSDARFSKSLIEALRLVSSNFKKNEHDAASYYGDNYPTVLSILNNDCPHTVSVKPRNKVWIRHIEQSITDYHIQKFIAFFGAAHTEYTYKDAITNRINAIPSFHGKTLHINAVYFNAYSAFTKSHLDCIGIIKGETKDSLYSKYLSGKYKATIINSKDIDDKHLKKVADFMLFVNDKDDKQ